MHAFVLGWKTRITAWLSQDGRKVAASETLEYRTDLVSHPTTGALLGDDLYFMGNTGIYNLKDDKIVDPAKLEPVHIAVVSLKTGVHSQNRRESPK